jgi:ribosomal protein L11 methyltransferase
MKWLEISVRFDESQTVSITDLVADVFFNQGLTGVTVETPWSEHTVDWASDAPASASRSGVIGYLPVDVEAAYLYRRLRTALRGLAQTIGVRLQTTYRRLDEEDWSKAWKKHYQPMRVTQRLVIKPSWKDFRPKADDIVIEIDPGMAFGTGTHPTTRLCLQLIEAYLKPEMRLIDVGTGSGILLIAGALLGATKGLAVDHDRVAVEVATANLVLNGVDPQKFKILQGSWGQVCDGPYDMVVTNIFTDVILKVIPDLPSLMKPQGIFIGSGILQDDRSVVETALSRGGLKVIEIRGEESWMAFAASCQ